jgi:hypothetical protein
MAIILREAQEGRAAELGIAPTLKFLSYWQVKLALNPLLIGESLLVAWA